MQSLSAVMFASSSVQRKDFAFLSCSPCRIMSLHVSLCPSVVPCQIMLHHVRPCYTILHHVLPWRIISQYVGPCRIMSHHVSPSPIMSHHVTPCLTTSHHVASCLTMHITASCPFTRPRHISRCAFLYAQGISNMPKVHLTEEITHGLLWGFAEGL